MTYSYDVISKNGPKIWKTCLYKPVDHSFFSFWRVLSENEVYIINNEAKNVSSEHLMQETRKKANFENYADVSKNMTSPLYVFLLKHIFPKSTKYSLQNEGSSISSGQIFWILWSFRWTRYFHWNLPTSVTKNADVSKIMTS